LQELDRSVRKKEKKRSENNRDFIIVDFDCDILNKFSKGGDKSFVMVFETCMVSVSFSANEQGLPMLGNLENVRPEPLYKYR